MTLKESSEREEKNKVIKEKHFICRSYCKEKIMLKTRNNFTILIIKVILLTFISTGGIAQTKKKKTQKENVDRFDYGGAKYNKKLSVSNYSFSRKFASHGKGEFLELSFDIQNKMDENVNLKMYIIGFYQSDKSVSQERKWIGYPEWRKRDIDKEQEVIYHLDSIPKIDKGKIDPDKKGLYEYPTFTQYLKYLAENADTGLALKLPGLEGTKEGLITGSNYNITMSPLKTTVFAKLYSPYGSQKYQFNYLGVVLYDTDLNEIVYRQFLKFNTKLKIY